MVSLKNFGDSKKCLNFKVDSGKNKIENLQSIFYKFYIQYNFLLLERNRTNTYFVYTLG